MHRSQFTQPKPSLAKTQHPSAGSQPKFTTQDLTATYVSKVTIQLAGNTKGKGKKLFDPRELPSPKPKDSNYSNPNLEKNYSAERLSYYPLRLEDKTPVGDTPGPSTPAPQNFISPRGTRQLESGIYKIDRTTPEPAIFGSPRGTRQVVSGIDSINRRRNLFHDSTKTNLRNVDSGTQDITKDHARSPPSTAISQRVEFPTTKHWYVNILQRLEDLRWNCQTLETEYSFLETLMNEQKEDLKKAKSWSKHLKNKKCIE
ncbi:uncharacterized protein [Montipora capricornis]|uniref:uncharacterized protein n=1 Tax=Montipora capricornis TaxID=246305 RepID=UPI0035F196FB